MAFTITKIQGATCEIVQLHLDHAIAHSRFSAVIKNHGHRLTIHNIRLRQSKDYCGNHPYACPVRPGGEPPHKKCTYLEGADWVAFNDGLNNVLDSLGVSAHVTSSICIIRKGRSRRMEYHGHKLGDFQFEWNKDSDTYADFTGIDSDAPASTYPADTPGHYAWD